jgi:dTDP-4-dehydrorhamnose reductase
MTHYLVSGASGLLGLNFALQVLTPGNTVSGLVNRHRLIGAPFTVIQSDLAQPGNIPGILEQTRPDVVIHCAAMANIDECETQPELAQRVNADLPGELAVETSRRGIPLVHISTDSVFDGSGEKPYREDDSPNPLNVYARTKLEGERQVMAANPNALIARVNFYGWSLDGERSLAEWFFYHLASGEQVKGFTDIFFCPLQVNQLVSVLTAAVNHELKGLYHVVSAESLSKYDFGLRIARAFGLDETLIVPVSWKEWGPQAVRSPNLRLDVSKLTRDLDSTLPGLTEGMQRLYSLFCEGFPQRLKAMRAD